VARFWLNPRSMSTLDRILIVAADAKPWAKLMREAGYEVEAATQAFDGLEKVAAFAPQLVVAELQIRGMDGLRFCQHVRAADCKPVVIAVAETNGARDAVAALRAGVNAYLCKPIDAELLRLVVKRALADRALQHQVEQLSECVHDLETSVARPIPPPPRPPGMPPVPGSTLSDLERYAILSTLKATGGSTSKAAKILGLSTRTIQYRMHLYNARQPRLLVAQRPQERQ